MNPAAFNGLHGDIVLICSVCKKRHRPRSAPPTDYDIVREACIKANPDIEVGEEIAEENGMMRPIRLADVLLAIREKMPLGNIPMGHGTSVLNLMMQHWNLRTDDLSQQSPETLKFLADLLR